MTLSGDPKHLLEQLQKLSVEDLSNDAHTRTEALALSRKLTASLEQPLDKIVDLFFVPVNGMAQRLGTELGLFAILCKEETPMSSEAVAASAGADPALVLRVLRCLAALDLVHESDTDRWSPSAATEHMAAKPIAAGNRIMWDVFTRSAVMAPKLLRETNYMVPSAANGGFFQYALQTKLSTFDLLNSDPSMLADFNDFMEFSTGTRPKWYDWYPIEDNLLHGFNESTPLLVDLGGGQGHDIQAFHQKFPGRGRLILQDLKPTLDGISQDSLDPSIETTVHDFFAEQPVRGARAYYFHKIFHDWADDDALRILHQVRKAMTPGYSRLLLHELVLPDRRAGLRQCNMDLMMMLFNCALERSHAQWQDLLGKAGFEIVRIWDRGEDDGLVEAVVKQ